MNIKTKKWYPRENAKPIANVKPVLRPEIAALPRWDANTRLKVKHYRCPCCGGYGRLNDANTDLVRDCGICHGEGKVLKR